MKYWILNKRNNRPHIADNLKVVEWLTGINLHSLYHNFSKAKVHQIESTDWRVAKLNSISLKETKGNTPEDIIADESLIIRKTIN